MSHVPPQEYYRSLPRHIAGAGAIFHDQGQRVLLVKPSYRETWEIPGGGMEAGEFPWETFDGGPLTSSEAERRISLQPGELTAWRMAAPQEWDTLLAPHRTRRIGACTAALASGGTACLHHGWQPGTGR
jgi:hypothetical protein